MHTRQRPCPVKGLALDDTQALPDGAPKTTGDYVDVNPEESGSAHAGTRRSTLLHESPGTAAAVGDARKVRAALIRVGMLRQQVKESVVVPGAVSRSRIWYSAGRRAAIPRSVRAWPALWRSCSRVAGSAAADEVCRHCPGRWSSGLVSGGG